ncbi:MULTISPECIES: MFS transporter [unclassified Microbacterium]|uniref:MFS transporter n=1 Tax=unclassified Microbacterium TaxID=2609290 RepID=UPI003015C965
MSSPLTSREAGRRFVLLSATRWFPVGLVFGLTVLLPLERGLTLPEVGVLLSLQGFVVLALELPTGGLADTRGRRPLLIVSGVLAVVAASTLVVATTFVAFAAAAVVQGVFRVLDSGPLEAWYVDSALAADPGHPIERGLSRAATVLGASIAAGALVCGGLVLWRPLGDEWALTLPFAVAALVYVVHTLLVVVLVREPREDTARADPSGQRRGARTLAAWGRGARSVVRDVPRVVAQGLRLLRTAPVLRALVLVEVFWSIAMIAFETLTPVGLADDLGGEDAAAAVLAPASAAAWGLFALGSLLAGRVSRRIGVARTAILARVLNGLSVVGMGVVAGPVGLLTGYGLAYVTHGAAGPMHSALLHREAEPQNRATVLSINSMVAGGAYSVGLLVLTPLAASTSTSTAFVAAGAVSILGALLYVPAWRRERGR